MKDELRFAAKHPWWVVGVVAVTVIAGSFMLETFGWLAYVIFGVIEWAWLTLIFTYYFNLYARNVDVEARAREEEL